MACLQASVAMSMHAQNDVVWQAGTAAVGSLQALAAHADDDWDQLDPDMPRTRLNSIQNLADKAIPTLEGGQQQEVIHMLVEPQRRFLSQACAWVRLCLLDEHLADCQWSAVSCCLIGQIPVVWAASRGLQSCSYLMGLKAQATITQSQDLPEPMVSWRIPRCK